MSAHPAELIATYKGRPARELTREELLEAYTKACTELQTMRESRIQEIEMDELFEDTRRAVRGR